MNHSYQAIYDAIRDENISHYVEQCAHAIAADMSMPHVLMRPKLSRDGNQWCALYGEDVQTGVAGFGDTPAKAMENFNHNWWNQTFKHR